MTLVRETEAADPEDPFRQGDILRLVNQPSHDFFPSLGVIINADCDLLHCKIDGVVSYLPLYSFNEYFCNFWLPSHVDNRRAELTRSICDICGISLAHSPDLISWINEEDVDSVGKRLSLTCKIKLSMISDKLHELAILTSPSVDSTTIMCRLIDSNFGAREQHLEKLTRTALRSLGDSQFFINEIYGQTELGFVIRMRRIYSLSTGSLYTTYPLFASKQLLDGPSAIRIARLTNLYRFKIAQMFAHQYSKIGLPDEITSLNVLAADAAIGAFMESWEWPSR